MSDLTPLDVLYEAESGDELELPSELARLYGRLRFPRAGRHVFGNFVTTLDGVVALGVPGHESGGAISGYSKHDRMVMGLLRAVADVVVTGAGTLRSVPDHLWTAEHIFPALADDFGQLRAGLGKSERPLNVIVSASGELPPESRVLRSGEVPVLIVTTSRGARRIDKTAMHRSVELATVAGDGPLSVAAVLDAAASARPGRLILAEAGPRLMANFFAERLLDELFLTLAPQIAGRDGSTERPGLVSGRSFAPDDPRWGALVGVRRGGSHLFLRYSFAQDRQERTGAAQPS